MSMISVDDALARCLALAQPLGVETAPLRAAYGRMMAGPVTARLTQPPFDTSAMDGYALGAVGAVGAGYTVVGESAAGRRYAGTIGQAQAVRIFTGAPLPMGAVAIAIQEDVARAGDHITLTAPVAARAHIRPMGQDFAAGDVLAPRILRAPDLGLLAAMNIPEVSVYRRPVVAIIATGNELVSVGGDPSPDQIIASNGYAIAAIAESAGAVVRMLPIAPDDRDALAFVFGLAAGADVIVTIGGASVGDHDLVGEVAADLGMQRAFWRIAMRPGKPLMAGRLMGAAMLGLPGNPVSSIVCAHLFLVPMLRAMQGQAHDLSIKTAVLGADLPPNGARAHYMRAQVKDGVITPFTAQDSARLRLLTEANALLINPADCAALKAGTAVSYIAL
jgi:molybdopterin molybdotransferase